MGSEPLVLQLIELLFTLVKKVFLFILTIFSYPLILARKIFNTADSNYNTKNRFNASLQVTILGFLWCLVFCVMGLVPLIISFFIPVNYSGIVGVVATFLGIMFAEYTLFNEDKVDGGDIMDFIGKSLIGTLISGVLTVFFIFAFVISFISPIQAYNFWFDNDEHFNSILEAAVSYLLLIVFTPLAVVSWVILLVTYYNFKHIDNRQMGEWISSCIFMALKTISEIICSVVTLSLVLLPWRWPYMFKAFVYIFNADESDRTLITFNFAIRAPLIILMDVVCIPIAVVLSVIPPRCKCVWKVLYRLVTADADSNGVECVYHNFNLILQVILLMVDIFALIGCIVTIVAPYRWKYSWKMLKNTPDDVFVDSSYIAYGMGISFQALKVVNDYVAKFFLLFGFLDLLHVTWPFNLIFRHRRRDHENESSDDYIEFDPEIETWALWYGFIQSVILVVCFALTLIMFVPLLVTVYWLGEWFKRVKTDYHHSGMKVFQITFEFFIKLLLDVLLLIPIAVCCILPWRMVFVIKMVCTIREYEYSGSNIIVESASPSAPSAEATAPVDAPVEKPRTYRPYKFRSAVMSQFGYALLDIMSAPGFICIVLAPVSWFGYISDVRKSNKKYRYHTSGIKRIFLFIIDVPTSVCLLFPLLSWRMKHVRRAFDRCRNCEGVYDMKMVRFLCFREFTLWLFDILTFPAYLLAVLLWRRSEYLEKKMDIQGGYEHIDDVDLAETIKADMDEEAEKHVQEYGYTPAAAVPFANDENQAYHPERQHLTHNIDRTSGGQADPYSFKHSSRFHSLTWYFVFLLLVDVLFAVLFLPTIISPARLCNYLNHRNDLDFESRRRRLLFTAGLSLLDPILLIFAILNMVFLWRVKGYITKLFTFSFDPQGGLYGYVMDSFAQGVIDIAHFPFFVLCLWRMPVVIHHMFKHEDYNYSATRRRVLVWTQLWLTIKDIPVLPMVLVLLVTWTRFYRIKEAMVKDLSRFHRVIYGEFLHLLLDLPFMLLALASCVTVIRIKFAMTALFMHTDKNGERRWIMFTVFLLALTDVFAIPVTLFISITWRSASLWRKYREVGFKNIMSNDESFSVLLAPFRFSWNHLWAVVMDIISFVSFVIIHILIFRTPNLYAHIRKYRESKVIHSSSSAITPPSSAPECEDLEELYEEEAEEVENVEEDVYLPAPETFDVPVMGEEFEGTAYVYEPAEPAAVTMPSYVYNIDIIHPLHRIIMSELVMAIIYAPHIFLLPTKLLGYILYPVIYLIERMTKNIDHTDELVQMMILANKFSHVYLSYLPRFFYLDVALFFAIITIVTFIFAIIAMIYNYIVYYISLALFLFAPKFAPLVVWYDWEGFKSVFKFIIAVWHIIMFTFYFLGLQIAMILAPFWILSSFNGVTYVIAIITCIWFNLWYLMSNGIVSPYDHLKDTGFVDFEEGVNCFLNFSGSFIKKLAHVIWGTVVGVFAIIWLLLTVPFGVITWLCGLIPLLGEILIVVPTVAYAVAPLIVFKISDSFAFRLLSVLCLVFSIGLTRFVLKRYWRNDDLFEDLGGFKEKIQVLIFDFEWDFSCEDFLC
ncbi:hypothetical protein PCE1_003406 [Barthelona sp. PCE]